MNTIHKAQEILASMAAHGDEERFISECYEEAARIDQIAYDDKTAAIIWYFPDLSRIEFDPHDAYIRAFSPSKHRVP